MLRMCGADIEEGDPVEFGDIKLSLYPMIYISPHFATCLTVILKNILGNEGKGSKIEDFKAKLSSSRL